MSTITPVSSISRQRPPKFMDFELLRAEGINHLEDLATFIWTDFNAHDPGITILEVLCYALTDLGYRVNFPFEDLMASEKGNYTGLFFSAADSLSTGPVTELDYRKLLIDVPGVKNAWLEKAEDAFKIYWQKIEAEAATLKPKTAKAKKNQVASLQQLCEETHYKLTNEDNETDYIRLNGLYKIILDLEDSSLNITQQRTQRIIERAKKSLHQNRNLCEDFVEFQIVENIQICLCLHLEIVADADGEETMAKAIFALQEFLTPSVKFYTLQQLLEKGLPGDQIYQGPLLQHGFLDDAEVKQSALRTEIFTSDLYNVLLAIPEVKSVKELQLKVGEEATAYSADWKYDLDGKKPVINPCCSNLSVAQGVITKKINDKNIAPFLDYYKLLHADIPNSDIAELPSPKGVFRPDLAAYTSIQHDFPRTYFLGNEMPSDQLGVERLAHIKQLKAYLSFFDRLLANYLVQLSKVRDLFAVEQDANAETIFYSALDQIPGIGEILNQNPLVSEKKLGYTQQAITQLLQKEKKSGNLLQQFIAEVKPKNRNIAPIVEDFLDGLRNVLPEQLSNLKNQQFQKEQAIELIDRGIAALFANLNQSKKTEFADIETLTITLGILFAENLYPLIREAALRQLSNRGDLRAIVEGEDNDLERREKILNHLIARFGEQFTDYTLELFQRSVVSSTYSSFEDYLRDKSNYLAHLPSLLRDRAKAYNYQLFRTDIPIPDVWNTTNVSGLKKKIYSLLGIKPTSASLMCDSAYDVELLPDPTKERRASSVRLIERNRDGSLKRVLLTSKESYPQRAALDFQKLIREKIETDAQKELADNNHPNFSVMIDPNSTVLYQVVYTPDEPTELRKAEPNKSKLEQKSDPKPLKLELRSDPRPRKDTDELHTYILELVNPDHCEREGFHLLEHILLRPNDAQDVLLAAPKTCEPTHPPVDPYSFWITVVLPAWPKRFKDKDFQKYFEQIFLAETPAHIAVCFLWIEDRIWMKRFEDAFEQWREAKAKCTPDECKVTVLANGLIAILQKKPCPCNCFNRDEFKSACAEGATNISKSSKL